jgi:hypothetical protein
VALRPSGDRERGRLLRTRWREPRDWPWSGWNRREVSLARVPAPVRGVDRRRRPSRTDLRDGRSGSVSVSWHMFAGHRLPSRTATLRPYSGMAGGTACSIAPAPDRRLSCSAYRVVLFDGVPSGRLLHRRHGGDRFKKTGDTRRHLSRACVSDPSGGDDSGAHPRGDCDRREPTTLASGSGTGPYIVVLFRRLRSPLRRVSLGRDRTAPMGGEDSRRRSLGASHGGRSKRWRDLLWDWTRSRRNGRIEHIGSRHAAEHPNLGVASLIHNNETNRKQFH